MATASVVYQHVRRRQAGLNGICKGLNFGVRSERRSGRKTLLGIFVLQRRVGAGQSSPVLGRKGDFPHRNSRRSVLKPNPDEPPVTAATRPSIVHSSRTSSLMRKAVG